MNLQKKIMISFFTLFCFIMLASNISLLLKNKELKNKVEFLKLNNDCVNKKYEVTKIISDFTHILNFSFEDSLFRLIYKNDSTSTFNIANKKMYYVYIEEKNCSKCVLSISQLATTNVVYIVHYRNEKWRNWLIHEILNGKEVLFTKNRLSNFINSNSPILIKLKDKKTLEYYYPITFDNITFINRIL